MEKKICRLCGQTKQIHLFEVDSRTKNKYTNRCRSCKHKLDDKAARAYRRLKRRSAKLNIPMEVTVREIRLLFSAFDGACAYCSRRPEKARNLHLEHIVALSEGGRNTLENLIPACHLCNAKKGTKPIATHFIENREKFPDENMAQVIDYISFLSGSKKKEVAAELADEHTLYMLKQARLAIGKEAK